MKVNATTRGRRICDTVGKMFSEYDQPVIVLSFAEDDRVEAAVRVDGAETIALAYIDVDIAHAIRGLESEVRARVASMAKSTNLDLARHDEDA